MLFVTQRVQEDCSCPFASCDFITSGKSGGAEYGVNSKFSKMSGPSLKNRKKQTCINL